MSLQKRRERENSDLEEIPVKIAQDIKKEAEIVDVVSEFEELSEIEKDILNIAKNVLKLKRYDSTISVERVETMPPLVEKLYADCIAKLSYSKGYSKEEIFLSMRLLEEKKWIVTNERRTKEEVLSDPKYQDIIEFIKNNPGIHGRSEKVEEELNITRNPFVKHLIVLTKFGIIRSKKFGKTLHYFMKDFPESCEDLVILFQNHLLVSILKSFISDSSAPITQIASDLDVYHGTIQYHIKRLKECKLLMAQESDGKKNYNPNFVILSNYNKKFQKPIFIED